MNNKIASPHLTQSGFVAIINGVFMQFPTEEEYNEYIKEAE